MGTLEACIFTLPYAPKLRKSLEELTSRMKRKRTNNLRGRELEELQNAVRRFKFNPATAPRSTLYGPNLSEHGLNLKILLHKIIILFLQV